METWPKIEFINLLFNSLALILLPYLIINIIIYKKIKDKDINKINSHKIMSMINIIIEFFIITILLHHFHILFMVFSPFIIMFKIMVGYGICEQLSEKEKNVKFGNIELQTSFNSCFFEIFCFPGIYLIKSWKK